MKQLILASLAPLVGLAVAGTLWAQSASSAEPDPSPADYAAAAKLLLPNLKDLVRNESVQPHWLSNSGRFWYRRDGEDGPQFVLVTGKGVKSLAFDHEALA